MVRLVRMSSVYKLILVATLVVALLHKTTAEDVCYDNMMHGLSVGYEEKGKCTKAIEDVHDHEAHEECAENFANSVHATETEFYRCQAEKNRKLKYTSYTSKK